MKRTTTPVSASPVHPTPRAERYWLRLLAATLRVSIRSCPEHTRLRCASNRTARNVSADGVLAVGALLWLLLSPAGLKAELTTKPVPSTAANVSPPNPTPGSEVKALTSKPCQIKPNAGPEMVLIAAGSFSQGSTNEDPGHQVSIDYHFAMSRCEVTVAEFRQFVEAQHYQTEAEKREGCYIFNANKKSWAAEAGASWQKPGFEQSENDPVVCVSWNDAKAYIQWLNGYLKLPSAKAYRLPTESEWEYAARAGTQTLYYWGDASQCAYANSSDESLKNSEFGKSLPGDWIYAACTDGFAVTAPVASFKANAWGLYDMSGNVWEWVEDCWHESYENAPSDGSAWLDSNAKDCTRSVRGGSWSFNPVYLRSAIRDWVTADVASSISGFRLARTL
ncbi:MAG: hypothetical protein CTY34_07735 [Methylobacter sp.]|nr:MAG: hypothetical protein CTY34_07735 [Methylobacter sp.]